jgi:glycerophosphoryl diester phosphodiesterase
VVAEAVPAVLKRLKDIVDQSHKAGLFFFTFGDANNAVEHYSAQRAAGVDAIILDDTARLAKVCRSACFCEE